MQNIGMITVGSSLGGLEALKDFFKEIPENFPVPIVIVHHRHSGSDLTLVRQIQRHCKMDVIEAVDKQKINPNKVYLAPTGYHLLVEKGGFALSVDSEVAMARPSVDVLFESAADIYREKLIGVVLTGSNGDGAIGLAKIKKLGGISIVQNPNSIKAKGSADMPLAAIKKSSIDHIMDPVSIGSFLTKNLAHKGTVQ